MLKSVTVVGGGLAGCECAWQLVQRGIPVVLIEQKPKQRTAAQHSDALAELVCSNSFRGADVVNAVGLLKEEMRRSGSLIIKCADQSRVPAGGALAVDRERFSQLVESTLRSSSLLQIQSEQVSDLPNAPAVIATGPLTAEPLAQALASLIGDQHLAYYDAIAPVIEAESIDWTTVFRASRYDKGGDQAYVNCALNQEQYQRFVAELLAAEKVQPKDFEKIKYFEGCLPIEVMAERGPLTLAYGPMKPVGLVDPKTGQRPFAVVQLRQEDHAASAYNMVGFQTRMKYPEQKRIFRTLPGLQNAEFSRFGSVHRNTFINAPVVCEALELRALRGVYVAGQISGVEGYVESAACGLLVGWMLAQRLRDQPVRTPPDSTALGSLLRYVSQPREVQTMRPQDYQPSNIVWSMFPPSEKRLRKRRERRQALAERALRDFGDWMNGHPGLFVNASQGPL